MVRPEDIFTEKLNQLETLSEKKYGMANNEFLLASAASNIKMAIERQLEYVDY